MFSGKNRSLVKHSLRSLLSIFTGLLLLLFCASTLSGEEDIVWPVDAKPAITSSFGEFRSGHFHSGIDLKVYGSIGLPCRAIGDGWVSRVKIRSGGYGKALYLTLEDYRTAVYAHLDNFAPAIEELVRLEQEKRREFNLDLYFKKDEAVHYKRGEVVCYQGRSGTKHPHVHFELRDANEKPMNALQQGFMLNDHVPPTPVALAIEPLDGYSTVELDCQPRIWSKDFMRRNDGVWAPRDPIGVAGRIGISIDAYDKMDAAENVLAVYSAEMFINGIKRWMTYFDEFSFSETALIETERNYRLYRRGKGVFHRLHHTAGNKLGFCIGDGVIDAGGRDEFPLEGLIMLSDVAGNQTRIEFELVPDEEPDDDRLVTGEPLLNPDGWGNPETDKISLSILGSYIRLVSPPGVNGFVINSDFDHTLIAESVSDGKIAVWTPSLSVNNSYSIMAVNRQGVPVETLALDLFPVLPSSMKVIGSADDLFEAEIPVGSVFDTLWVRIIPEPCYILPGEVESVYRVEPMDQPLNGQVTIKLTRADSNITDFGWGVYYMNKRVGWTFLGNERKGGFLTASAMSWEVFGLVVDRDTPFVEIIKPEEGQFLKVSNFLVEVAVNDTTSGISASNLTMLIDGEKVPAEYDAPRKRLLYKPWKYLTVASHQLTVSAVDRVGNETIKSVNFRLIP